MFKHTVQLKDICLALDVPYRSATYVLESGYVPKGVAEAPSTGNHRQFDASQAFWLAMILMLKADGINTALAAQIADYAWIALRTTTQNLGWEPSFLPHLGRLDTKHQYFVEIAARKYIRFGTTSEPLSGGKIKYFDWHAFTNLGRPVKDLQPCVKIHLDLTAIAALLKKVLPRPYE